MQLFCFLGHFLLPAPTRRPINRSEMFPNRNTSPSATSKQRPYKIMPLRSSCPSPFFPDAGDCLITSLDLNDGIPSSMSAFWVTNDSISILFDTGMGGSQSQLLPHLKSLGISPEEVEYIYLTHFHGDHIGGLMRGDTIVFPNAQLYASKVEYEAWLDMEAGNGPATKAMNAYNDRLHLFAFGDTLPGEV